LVLLRTGSRPWQQYAELVEHAGSAVAVLEQEQCTRGGGQVSLFPPGDVEQPKQLLAAAASDIERWRTEGMQLLTVLDAGYPENLRAVHDRPPAIFVAGQLDPQDARSLAVIGAREASAEGTSAARAVAVHLVQAGFTVFSGLAAGIDSAAHTAALGAGGRTVAVIGTGLRRAYPPQNAVLQRRIVREGAVISQFRPDHPPSRRTFPMRNAVMSGLTLGSVVVEASRTSGARLQARLALAHGRPVFLLEQLLREAWAREFAQRPGTHVISEPAEITRVVERLTSAGALSP
jgi:DNA processing protein